MNSDVCLFNLPDLADTQLSRIVHSTVHDYEVIFFERKGESRLGGPGFLYWILGKRLSTVRPAPTRVTVVIVVIIALAR
jgi:hypothetical protein